MHSLLSGCSEVNTEKGCGFWYTDIVDKYFEWHHGSKGYLPINQMFKALTSYSEKTVNEVLIPHSYSDVEGCYVRCPSVFTNPIHTSSQAADAAVAATWD